MKYKSRLSIMNKTYSKDLRFSVNLYKSWIKFGLEKDTPYYIITPKNECELFISEFKKEIDSKEIESAPTILSECQILTSAGLDPDVIYQKFDGWRVQQIIKLCFSLTGISEYYLSLDSAQLFIKSFSINDVFFTTDGLPKTFAEPVGRKQRNDFYRSTNHDGFLKGQLVNLSDSLNYIDDFFGDTSDQAFYYIHAVYLFSSERVELLHGLLPLNGIKDFAEMIEISPYEFAWYGAFCRSIEKDNFRFTPTVFLGIFNNVSLDEYTAIIKNFFLTPNRYGIIFQPPVSDIIPSDTLYKLGCCDLTFDLTPITGMATQVGKIEYAIRTTGKAGVLCHGPYIELTPGRYIFFCSGNAESWTGREVIDISADLGQKQLKCLDISNIGIGFWRLMIDISINETEKNIELRVFVDNETRISINDIGFLKLS